MVKLLNIIKIAFKNIKSNKLRSALTMLGLIIGIASVIVLVELEVEQPQTYKTVFKI